MAPYCLPTMARVRNPVAWAESSTFGSVIRVERGRLEFGGMPHIDYRPIAPNNFSAFLIEARDAWILSASLKGSRMYYVMTGDGYLLVDGLNLHPRYHLNRPDFASLHRDVAVFADRQYFVKQASVDAGILIGGMPNVYHWYLEYMSRLLHMPRDTWDSSPLLLNADLSTLQSDSLRTAGLHNFDGCLDLRTAVHVDRLLIPSIPSLDQAVRHLRESLLYEPTRAVPRERQIYVSRSDTTEERLTDPRGWEARYESAGFEIVLLAQLTFAEQVEMFASAKAIAGPHGAGLVNAIFLDSGASIAEIFNSQNRRYTHFADLARSLGVEYRPVLEADDNRGPIGRDRARDSGPTAQLPPG